MKTPRNFEPRDNATFLTWEEALYASYNPVGTAGDVRNVLNIRNRWRRDELRDFVMDLHIVDSPEGFDNALDELLRNWYARIKTVDGISYLSSCLPIERVADLPKASTGTQ